MTRSAPLLVTLCLVVVPAIAKAQDSDTTPPTLTALDFTPKTVDVTAGPVSLTVTGSMTDDLSGPGSIQLGFTSPSGRQYHYGFAYPVGLGNTLSGNVTIPQYVESGTWHADVWAFDSVGNRLQLDAAALIGLGFPASINVLSIPDTTPPVVASATFAPDSIDVSDSDQVVTLDLRVTDDVAGLDSSGFPNQYTGSLWSPSAGRYLIATAYFVQASGSSLDGTWRLTWTLPQYSEAGTWRMYVSLRDRAGNYSYTLADTFDVVSSLQDRTPPTITGLRFSPAVINTSTGSVNVTVTLDAGDDLSGVEFNTSGYFSGVLFESPSSGQRRSACCGSFTMASGTVMNGTWRAEAFFPQFSEAGTWKASTILWDRVRNLLNLSSSQLAALELQTDLVVVRPSLVGDGSVTGGGGTVFDDTFDERASITFPPGAVSSETDVALDVFPDPLALPTPQGFQGPGTYFVNVNLTPAPVYPFPPPGVTATLPLPSFLSPGTLLSLYVVDTQSGVLEPMPHAVTGLPVVGTVNAGGLSATFTGISHFSILVGLLPDVIHVAVDIKPNTFPNDFKLGAKGKLPVAILSSATFNAVATVNRNSLTFGKTGAEASLSHCGGSEDVNGDARADLVCHFDRPVTGFGVADTTGVLRGRTMAGQRIQGTDSVRIIR